MRKLWVYVCLCAFGVTGALVTLTPAIASADHSLAISQPSSTQTDQESKQVQTFQGRITQAEGRYVLDDGQSTFLLDDQEKAKQFDGKNVKVTGTLDIATNIIHVSEIQAAA